MTYYRVIDRLVSAGVDEFDNPLGPARVTVQLNKLEVIKETLKGVWLNYYGSKRFVLNSSRKRFACPSLEEAKESFRARKKRQLKILYKQVSHVELALKLVEDIKEEENAKNTFN